MTVAQNDRRAAAPMVAAEAAPSITAFRDKGSLSFQDVGVEQARVNYSVSCAANGLTSQAIAKVSDVQFEPHIPGRLYDARPGAPKALAPAIFFIHGGGWVIGDLDTHDSLCRHLAVSTECIVVAVDYRLAPEAPFPAAIDDCRSALTWVLTHGEKWGIDIARVVVMGDSGGGQMAAILANESGDDRFDNRLIGQVLLYPVTDLTMQTPSYERIVTGFPLTANTMSWFADHYVPEGVDRSQAQLSPLLNPVPAYGAAAFICTVDNDPLADEGARYAAKLAAAGTAVEYLHLPGHSHGLFTSAGVLATAREVLNRVSAFITARSTAAIDDVARD